MGVRRRFSLCKWQVGLACTFITSGKASEEKHNKKVAGLNCPIPTVAIRNEFSCIDKAFNLNAQYKSGTRSRWIKNVFHSLLPFHQFTWKNSRQPKADGKLKMINRFARFYSIDREFVSLEATLCGPHDEMLHSNRSIDFVRFVLRWYWIPLTLIR